MALPRKTTSALEIYLSGKPAAVGEDGPVALGGVEMPLPEFQELDPAYYTGIYYEVAEEKSGFGGAFPRSLGPFDLASPTTFGVKSIKLETPSETSVWDCSFDMTAFKNPKMRTLQKLVEEHSIDLKATMSPIAKVTLPEDARKKAGIPENAEWFAYCSAFGDGWSNLPGLSELVNDQHLVADFALLMLGHFCYFDKDRNIVKMNALKPAENHFAGGLPFHGPKAWLPKWTAVLRAQGRWQRATIPALGAKGVFEFAWIKPEEPDLPDFPSCAHGAFVYIGLGRFRQGIEKDMWKKGLVINFPPLPELPESKNMKGIYFEVTDEDFKFKGTFPRSMGPFSLKPVSLFCCDDITVDVTSEEAWKVGGQPVHVTKKAFRAPEMKKLLAKYPGGQDSFAGKISPVTAVNLSESAKKANHIPANAVSFAWCSRLGDQWPEIVNDVEETKKLYDSDANFLTVGSFLYFDKDYKCVAINSLIPFSAAFAGGLKFGPPKDWLPQWTDVLDEHDRWNTFIFPEFQKMGVVKYAWIRPVEEELPFFPRNPHGCFALVGEETLLQNIASGGATGARASKGNGKGY